MEVNLCLNATACWICRTAVEFHHNGKKSKKILLLPLNRTEIDAKNNRPNMLNKKVFRDISSLLAIREMTEYFSFHPYLRGVVLVSFVKNVGIVNELLLPC